MVDMRHLTATLVMVIAALIFGGYAPSTGAVQLPGYAGMTVKAATA